MARYAIVDVATKIVQNVSEWDGVTTWRPPAGTVAVPVNDDVVIGGILDRGNYVPPAPLPPPPVDPTVRLAQLEARVASLEEPT